MREAASHDVPSAISAGDHSRLVRWCSWALHNPSSCCDPNFAIKSPNWGIRYPTKALWTVTLRAGTVGGMNTMHFRNVFGVMEQFG